jgi:hypothetical protein
MPKLNIRNRIGDCFDAKTIGMPGLQPFDCGLEFHRRFGFFDQIGKGIEICRAFLGLTLGDTSPEPDGLEIVSEG